MTDVGKKWQLARRFLMQLDGMDIGEKFSLATNGIRTRDPWTMVQALLLLGLRSLKKLINLVSN